MGVSLEAARTWGGLQKVPCTTDSLVVLTLLPRRSSGRLFPPTGERFNYNHESPQTKRRYTQGCQCHQNKGGYVIGVCGGVHEPHGQGQETVGHRYPQWLGPIRAVGCCVYFGSAKRVLAITIFFEDRTTLFGPQNRHRYRVHNVGIAP
jgi:hypothetical protein